MVHKRSPFCLIDGTFFCSIKPRFLHWITKKCNSNEFVAGVGEREQMNQNSAYIDASMVYGTTHLEANVRLRVHERGYLRSRLHQDGRFLLAISTDPKDGCNRPQFNQINRYCFKSGRQPIFNTKVHLAKIPATGISPRTCLFSFDQETGN